ncbi:MULTISPECIES: ATP-grasp domain-containing protein [Streptomyces]|uniref:ATP-grasp domain-containing protein n=1 Tax=Streptomyces TaxID=1883 RepID=UPI00163C3679|nr:MULTISPECIES: ATP-grasp domain-containing protein [Streptomyces]MBC2879510.1 ATP-grasp domain-containing protein [Streptomyces sp. TYQ1024]UBI35012.1 ATP-grasp domain-containing protein [Streptomyces mobaraensis]UKW27612.1 ATP-grasp domain-containing protein [Streptomyces sp. TYQ1024]
MASLLLNRRPILSDVPGWLPAASLVVVTAAPAAAGVPLGGFRHVETVPDYEDDAAVDRVIDALCRDHRVERVLTTAEIDVVRAARARERHGLPGQSVESALAYRDKYRMKRLAARGGVPVAPMARVRDTDGVRSFAARHGFPVVVKPADGGGSVGVRVLRDASAAARLPAGEGLLVERFVDGVVCHVDGLMAGGRVLHAVASRYLHSNLDTAVRGLPSVSGMLPADEPVAKRLCAAAADTVAALPPVVEVTAFHAEFFHTPDDGIVLCEIACRPGGCGIPQAYELTTGVQPYAAQLRGQAGRISGVEVAGGRPRHGWAWFPPRAGVLRCLPASCPLPGTVRYTACGRVGARYRGPASSTDRVAELVFRVDDARPLEDVLREVDDWWAGAVRWE